MRATLAPLVAAAAAAVLWHAIHPAVAQDARGLGPTEIMADELIWDEETATATALGNAVAEQGGRTLRAERFVAYAHRRDDGSVGEVRLIEADGGVIYTTANGTARGDKGRYDLDAGTITLAGNVEVIDAGDVVRGTLLTIDLVKGTSQITGQEGVRPSIRLGPSGNDDNAQ